MLKLTIDGQQVEVAPGTTILEAAEQIGIRIPTLCHLKGLTPEGSCRMCVVEVEGMPALRAACSTPCENGKNIFTHSERVIQTRRSILDLLLSNHSQNCFSCHKSGECELQNLCYEYDIENTSFIGEKTTLPVDDSNEFFSYDPSQCIMCRRCQRTCEQLHANGTLGLTNRGFKARVAVPFDMLLKDSTCVSCGNCVSNCPTGALKPKSKMKYRSWDVSYVRTTCAYCGVGCQMDLVVKDDNVVGVKPADGPSNKGLLCVKGKFGYNFINHADRLKTPLIKKDGQFTEATWDEALDLIASKINSVKAQSGADALAGFSSARVTNEENYVFQKLFRAAVGTNNVDHCARLCHASTVAGLATTLGSGAMTNSITEVVDSNVILVSGSNTTENHPVIGSLIRQALRKGAKLIVAEPREIPLAKQADIFLQIKPGTNVALFNGLMNVIITEGLQDKEYIEKRTEGYDELVAIVKDYTPQRVAEICGIDAEDLKAAARIYAAADAASLFYSMGVTQHSTGTEGVMSTSNLALLCGNIGKYGAGVNPLRGQNNVQGACDMGALPGDFPAYQKVANPAIIEKFEKAWGVSLSDKPGLTITEVISAVEKGDIRMLYIMGENPMISDPDSNHVEHALNKCEFLVVQDIFLTETAALADVVLPAATFAEKDGTFTNTERRIQRVRAAIKPVGQSRADWDILNDLMARLGYKNSFTSPAQIMDEIASVAPSYAGISYDRLEKETLQWPCTGPDHAGTPILHTAKFSRGERALLKPITYKPSAEQPDGDYPFIFTTGRILYQYHTRTMTGKVDGLNAIAGESYVEINPTDAKRFDIACGDMVKVASRRGEVEVKAVVTDRVEENVLFMPFHYAQGSANKLTNPVVDPIAKIPEFKVCAVKIAKA